MRSESDGWRRTTIGALGQIVTGKTPSTRDPRNFGGPYPFIKIPDLRDQRYIRTATETLSERGANAIRSAMLPAGAVLVSCIATIGEVGITTRPSFTNQQINAILPSSDIDPKFLYYSCSQLKPLLSAAGGGGSVYTNVSKGRLSKIEITLPPSREQHRIAWVLGSIDDKIEANHQIAKTLEEIAAAIFKARFVDFVGVEEFEESELGPIPKGWSAQAIGNVLRVVGGSTPSTKEPSFWNGRHHWATPKDLSGLDSPILLSTARRITDAGLAKIGSGLLPENTVLLSCRAPIGYTAIARIPAAVNQGFIAIPPSNLLPAEFILFWLRENLDRIMAAAGGTTFAEISKKAFRPLPIVVPELGIVREFTEVVRPVFDQLVALEREARTLATIRGTLLPKLISGEVRVPEGFGPEDAGEVAEELAASVSDEAQEAAARVA